MLRGRKSLEADRSRETCMLGVFRRAKVPRFGDGLQSESLRRPIYPATNYFYLVDRSEIRRRPRVSEDPNVTHRRPKQNTHLSIESLVSKPKRPILRRLHRRVLRCRTLVRVLDMTVEVQRIPSLQ